MKAETSASKPYASGPSPLTVNGSAMKPASVETNHPATLAVALAAKLRPPTRGGAASLESSDDSSTNRALRCVQKQPRCRYDTKMDSWAPPRTIVGQGR